MKKLFLLALISLLNYVSYSQALVRGKVTDENGEAVIGAPVVLKSNRAVGMITDINGNYSLKLPDSIVTAQMLVVSYIGYKTVEVPFTPIKNTVVIRDVAMELSNVLEAVEITAKTVKAKDNYMERRQVNAPNSLNYISSETIKRTGDATVTAAVARVSGVSTNGGFITVRGIGDRYVKTTVNGSRIPTLDPFTNNIKLDMFPGSLVDNIVITKTASPDLPADWAGAYISIETKDYPDNLTVDVETTVGYNNQTSFKDMITTQRSNTDWLGYDNSLRDRSHDNKSKVYESPTYYQQFIALGYGDYFNSMGITEKTPWIDTYTKLGLEKLGFLQKGEFNDVQAFTNAKMKYSQSTYNKQANTIINADAVKLGQSLPNNWVLSHKKAPLDFTQSFSIGNQSLLFGKPLGYLFGFRYVNAVQSDPNSIYNRPNATLQAGTIAVNESVNQNISMQTNGWSALLNLAYSFNPNHSVSLLFMPNLTGINKAHYDEGAIRDIGNYQKVYNQDQFYEQRKQLVYQLKTQHYLPGPKIKIDLNASYTKGNSNAPDFKTLKYGGITNPNDDFVQYAFDNTYFGGATRRIFRYLDEDILDLNLSAELPIGNKPDLPRKIKIGGAYQDNTKENNQYIYELKSNENFIKDNDIEAYFDLDKFQMIDGKMSRYYERNELPANSNFGFSKVSAGFLMLDYTITSAIRFSGGLRLEHANIFTDVLEYYKKNLPIDDERRKPTSDRPVNNPGELNEISYLPSANIIYKLKRDEQAPLNLRLSYSQTVARPSVRELSDTWVYDYELRAYVYGDPNLKMVKISNYDLRLESYFKSGDNISISLFYKDFNNHIELIRNATDFTWRNAGKSNIKGIELEGKKVLLENLELRANITLVDSRTTYIENIYTGEVATRKMYGQAPYVINGILSYAIDKQGMTLALTYNLQGPRLVIASANVLHDGAPDVYELPRHLFDFKVAKSLGRHFSVSLKIRDILNTSITRAYKYEKGSGLNLDYDKYTYGTNYVLGLSYKL